MASLIIAHEPAASRFVARLAAAGPVVGELLYTPSAQSLDIHRTFVAKEGRGLGVAAQLADAACAHAAARSLNVLATCSYISGKYFSPPPVGWAFDPHTRIATRELQ